MNASKFPDCFDLRPCCLRRKLKCTCLSTTYKGENCPFAKERLSDISYHTAQCRNKKEDES